MEEKIRKTPSEMIKRYIFMLAGVAAMALGVAFSIRAALGIAPVSSVPYVLSMLFPISVGTFTALLNSFFTIMQIVLLRRKFQMIQLLQIPVAFVFGYLIDFMVSITGFAQVTTYVMQWVVLLSGVACVAVGVSMQVVADVLIMPGEGLVLAIHKITGIKYGNVKIVFDVSMLLLSVVISLVFLGELTAVREGSIAVSLLTGTIIKPVLKFLLPKGDMLFKKQQKNIS